ncbi:DUF1992 domain-containing protein [Catellatospora sp. TT07R-123]|uniref:DnaJ family domain-containing protein n=1 Tax=Catellatospora sp. TT07R-123 TaxID=2733863 RepID=UPI001B11E399|nr:DUF1992 domain-containing protein [Catellatospora sp. TT07R-123]GHJ48155.1 DUF1992 domain-containing protein [Catellatospora sp. TT07R-123]
MGPAWESAIDRQIREAQERGDFDDLPGTGKPLPGAGEVLPEDWWLRDLARRENLAGALPATLLLRRDIEDLPDKVARKLSEAAVRAMVAEINTRVVRANRGLLNGPAVVLGLVDADQVVRDWKARRRAR